MPFIYKGLTGVLEKHTVTDTELDHQIQKLVLQTPRYTAVTHRPAQLGDEVVLDYAGSCQGQPFPGGTARMQTLVLGSGTFIPGFEEQLIGAAIGQEVTVEVTFPEKYHAPDLAGKDARFQCTIHQIRIKGTYQADDDFAKEVGGCDTMAQFREKLRADLQDYADRQGEMELQDQLLRQAAATLDVTFSQEQIDQAVEEQLRRLQAQLARQGLTLEMYCSFLNTTPEALRADARPEAEAALRGDAAVARIAAEEGVEATQQELAQALALVCRQNGMTVEQIRPHYGPELEAQIEQSVIAGKVTALIRDHAQVTERTV